MGGIMEKEYCLLCKTKDPVDEGVNFVKSYITELSNHHKLVGLDLYTFKFKKEERIVSVLLNGTLRDNSFYLKIKGNPSDISLVIERINEDGFKLMDTKSMV